MIAERYEGILVDEGAGRTWANECVADIRQLEADFAEAVALLRAWLRANDEGVPRRGTEELLYRIDAEKRDVTR